MFNPITMLNMFIKNNPQLAQYWDMAQKMTKNKSPQEIQQMAKNLAQQRNIDLNEVTQMMQQFMGGNFKI